MNPEEMAAELRKLGWSVRAPLTPQTCQHPNMRGASSIGTCGTRSYGHCPDCGYSYDYSSPPVAANPTWGQNIRN